MLARSVRNPLIISVGTGVILVSGTAYAALAAAAGDATPSPSADATPTPPKSSPGTASPKPTSTSPTTPTSTGGGSTGTPPPLVVELKRISSGAVHAGTVVKFTATVKATSDAVPDVRLTLGAKPDAHIDAICTFVASQCRLSTVDKSGIPIDFSLKVPTDMKSGGTIKVSADAFSGSAQADSGDIPYSLTVTKAPKPKPTHSSGSGSGSGGSSGSSGSSGHSGTSGSGSSGAGLPVGGTGAVGGGAVPTPSNSALLPSVAPQQTQAPVTAPGTVQNTGNSQRMRGTAADADELTFDKLASTQAAWLAALLVAFALLMTQVRLGRVHVRDLKQKGAHRRPRRSGSAH